jgi:hypothetical protein
VADEWLLVKKQLKTNNLKLIQSAAKKVINFMKTKKFNLIEIILTIAIVGVSLACITPLFIKGFQDNKIAVTDSYSARASQNIYVHIAQETQKTEDIYGNPYDGWKETLGNNAFIPAGKPTFEIPKGGEFIFSRPKDSKDKDIEFGNLYEISGAPDGVYGIMAKTGNNTDIKGEVRIWQSAISEAIISNDEKNKMDPNDPRLPWRKSYRTKS